MDCNPFYLIYLLFFLTITIKLSLELSSKFLSQLDDEKIKRLERMLHLIRTDINNNGNCMLQDGLNILPLCVVPYYEDKLVEISEMGEFSHKAPVLLDCFFENYTLESWDLTTKMVRNSYFRYQDRECCFPIQ